MMTTAEAKRNRILAETKRLSAMGIKSKEIARQLGVKCNLIYRLRDLIESEVSQ